MTRGFRGFVISWWGWVLLGAIVLFWVGCMGSVIFEAIISPNYH